MATDFPWRGVARLVVLLPLAACCSTGLGANGPGLNGPGLNGPGPKGLQVGVAPAPPASVTMPGAWFEEIAARAGFDRPHHRRRFENPYALIMEGYTALGAAAAVADFDGDGFEDLFVTDSSRDGENQLYRNNGDLTFTEMAAAAGVGGGNDGANAAANALWFDFDGDGDSDLLVVRFGHSLLYENRGDRTFQDVTDRSGLPAYANSIAAIAFDYDLDGDLDLGVANYFQPVNLFDPDTPRFFPESFETANNGGGVVLLANDGTGAFTDVTVDSGLAQSGWALDLGHADADQDGDEDLYVAVDFGTDRFFVNNGDGTFSDATERAVGIDTKKGMNADWGDFDNDGAFDLYVTNITDEYMREGNFLWRNNGDGTFTDVARETGTHETGWGWAGKFFDYDNDGWLDLYVVNGWVSAGEGNYVLDIFDLITGDAEVDLTDLRNWPPMGDKTLSGYQSNRLFHNLQGTLFRDEAPRHGLDSQLDGRGVVVADFDRDGRQDLFVTNADGLPLLFHNLQPTGHGWLTLELAGTASNRDAIGARVWITVGGERRVSFVNGGNGFASQSSRRLHFGLGEQTQVERLEVAWPSGARQSFEDVAAGRRYQLVEGEPELTPLSGDEGVAPMPPRPVVQPEPPVELRVEPPAETPAEPSAAPPPSRSPAVAISEAARWFEQGLAAVAAGELETALDRLEAATAAEPGNLHYGAELRQAAIAAGAYDRALALFNRLAGEYPDEPAVHLNRGLAYVDKVPLAGAITGVLLANRALESFTRALELEESWLGYFTRGNSYIYWPKIFGRTALGIADLKAAIALADQGEPRPYHARAWAALGDGYWRLGDSDQARAVWLEGQERFPASSDLAARLALEGEALDAFLERHFDPRTRVATDLRALQETP